MFIRRKLPLCPECNGTGRHIVFGSKCRCESAKEIAKEIKKQCSAFRRASRP